MKPTKASEKRYFRDLKKIAKATAMLVASHTDDWRFDVAAIQLLKSYSESLTPWAIKTASRMISEVATANGRSWEASSNKIGRSLKAEMTGAIGRTTEQLQRNQVELIKSIPLEAGERAQRLSLQVVTEGRRAAEVAAEIARTENVTVNRAMLIARTEVARANASITQARAESVGVSSYYWRSSSDGDVRDSHAEMDGKIFRFDSPPYIEGEGNHGPGETFNCRCYAEPIIQEAQI